MKNPEQAELKEIDFGTVLSSFINREDVTDIMVWEKECWVSDVHKGHYRIEKKEFADKAWKQLEELLYKIPRQIAIRMQVSFNEGNPILDGESDYGRKGQLRINAIHESLTGSSPALAIRKSLYGLRISEESMLEDSFAPQAFLDLMEATITSGCNVMIAGSTGSGKTELLKYLSRHIPDNEAVITMEDTLEAYLKRLYPQKNVLSLKSNEHVGFGELLRSCLRQNPDWICLSEVRGKEVRELLEAAGTGHHLISTLHADSALSIPYRMLDMAKADGAESVQFFRRIHATLDLGVHLHYVNDEKGAHRRVSEVAEFFLDENGEEKSRLILSYDFVQKRYLSARLHSMAIRKKLAVSGKDTEKIRGIFL